MASDGTVTGDLNQNLLRWSLKLQREPMIEISNPKLEFTPLEFETRRSVGTSIRNKNQNLLRWSLKRAN